MALRQIRIVGEVGKPDFPMEEKAKYVATHRPDTLEWGPFESLGPDIVADVHRIGATNGPDLIL